MNLQSQQCPSTPWLKNRDIEYLTYRVRTLVRTFEYELNTHFFKDKEVYMDEFVKKLLEIFDSR